MPYSLSKSAYTTEASFSLCSRTSHCTSELQLLVDSKDVQAKKWPSSPRERVYLDVRGCTSLATGTCTRSSTRTQSARGTWYEHVQRRHDGQRRKASADVGLSSTFPSGGLQHAVGKSTNCEVQSEIGVTTSHCGWRCSLRQKRISSKAKRLTALADL